MKANKTNSGFTLIEVLIAMAMLGILVAVALPSFQSMIGQASTDSASKAIANSLVFARGESIARGVTTSICPKNAASTDCAAGAWSNGWIIFIDNNADADGAINSIDLGDQIIQVSEPLASVVLTGTTNLIQYNSRGFRINTNVQNFTFCPQDNDANNAVAIEVSPSGRVRLSQGGIVCP